MIKPITTQLLFKTINLKLVFINFLWIVSFFICSYTYSQTIVSSIHLGPEVGNGIDPVAIAINTNTNRIYTANESSGNVSVIDSVTNEVIALIDVGDTPSDIKISPISNTVYVSNSGSNDVTLIEGETNLVINTIAVGNSPKGIAINLVNNRIYVVNQDSNNVSVIDGTSNEVIETIDIGSAPSDIAVNSATNLLYVVNTGSNTVTVIDGSNNKDIATITTDVDINKIRLNETTNHIYVTGCCKNNPDIGLDTFTGEIIVIDGSTNEVIKEVSIGCFRSPGLSPVCSSEIFDIDVNEELNQIYVSSFDMYFVSPRDFEFVGFLSVIDGLSFEVTDNIEIGYDPRGITVDSSNNLVYVVNKGNHNVSVIDITEKSVTNTINIARLPFEIDFVSESNRVYVTNTSSNDVSVINNETGSITTHVPVGIKPKGLTHHTNKNIIYVTNTDSHTLSVIDSLTNEVIETIEVGCNPVDVAVDSQTNNIFVVLSNEPGGMRICDNSPSVKVIDGLTHNIITTIFNNSGDDFFNPVSITINSEINRIYVADENNNSICVIDGTINEIVNTIELSGKPGKIDVNPLSNRIYVTTGSSVTVIDGVNENVIDEIEIGSSLSGIKVNPDLNHIYVNDSTNALLSFIDGFTHDITAGIKVGTNLQGIGVDVKNSLVYVVDQDSGKVIIIRDDLEISPTPILPVPQTIIVNPDSAKSSLQRNETIVTILDQFDQPLSGIIVESSSIGFGTIVNPSSVLTGEDGTAKFKFRFGFITNNGEITFTANGLSASIVQE